MRVDAAQAKRKGWGVNDRALLDTLPATSRLALAYAPRAARGDWLTLLAFDARLAAIVRQAREPLLGQMRLAWWRDRLGEVPGSWPRGEPLLAVLPGWQAEFAALAALVDGWELLLGEAPLPPAAFAALADARAAALVALAHRLGQGDTASAVHAAGRDWALADMRANLSAPAERTAVESLAEPCATAALPRAMRPLAVLHALARRATRTSPRPLDLLVALRVGLFGR